MVVNFRRKILVSAVLSAISLQGIAAVTFAEESKSEQTTNRYIIKYKKSALPMALMADKMVFDTSAVTSELKSKGIEVKRVLPSQASVSVELNAETLIELQNNPNVETIEKDHRRKLLSLYEDTPGDPNTMQLTPYAIIQSQADQLNLQTGQKVCVIDSGIAGSDGETGGLNNDFEWGSITGDDDAGTGSWNADGGPHGTHVAGTVAAADNGIGVIGMAPGVPLHIVKVFNDAGWGYSSDLAHAAEKCTDAGATIITMSLGGGGANSTEENAFIAFTENGGLVLAAAGNDGNDTRSYPAGYDSVMMIGANDGDNNIASFSQFPSCNAEKTDCVEVTAGGVNTLSTYPSNGATIAGLTADNMGYAASAMENTGSTSGTTFFMGTAESTDTGADGNICVIDRGNITFHDKVKNCEDSGGIGAIIINNTAGLFNGTLGDTNTTTIPVVGTALEDRDALISATSAAISVGPGDYGLMSGTSMATPGVAGIAALVWSNFPHCTGSEIRHALKTSAEDSGDAGHDVYFGNGIVKAKAASDYLIANGCAATPPAGSIQFAQESDSVNEDGGAIEITFERVNGTYGEVSFDVATADGSALAGSDYTAFSQTVTMADGETSKTIAIEIINDSDYEGDVAETFSLNLFNPSANTQLLEPNQIEIGIIEDDPMPPAGNFVLSSASYSVAEDDANLLVTINRVNGDFGDAFVDIVSSADSASSGEDFEAINQTVMFAHGETSKTVTLVMLDDSEYEGDEQFNLELLNPSARSTIETPATSVVTISEDDPQPPAGELNWTNASLTLDESAGTFNVIINRDNGSFGECVMTASVSHNSTSANDISGNTSVELTFADGETSKSTSFGIVDDTEDESDESFSLVLTSQSQCTVGATGRLTVTVTDNDESSGGGVLHWIMLLPLLILRRFTAPSKVAN